MCYILSFEEDENVSDPNLRSNLSNCGIKWIEVRSIKKDRFGFQRIQYIIGGFIKALQICRRERINVVHCRSYRPAFIGGLIKLFLGSGFLFDMRGFLIDELVADSRWNKNSLKYRIAKQVERGLILFADVITVTSPQFKESVLSLPYFPSWRANNVISIPNCTDVDRFLLVDTGHRQMLREKLGLNRRLVTVFAGDAFRYRDTLDGIIHFFEVLKSFRHDAYLILAVYGNPNDLKPDRLLTLGDQNYEVISIKHEDIPELLASSDIGLSFFKGKNFSNTIASPIKFAEYLSCGLPVVINPGIGDTARIIEQYKIGIVIDPEKPEQLNSGVATLLKMLDTDPGLRQRCHAAADKELSLDLSEDLYFQAYNLVFAAAEKRMKR